jgi:uncharacterized protein
MALRRQNSMKRLRCFAALLIISAATTTIRAQSLPRLTAPVNDFAQLIDSESARELDRRIRALEAKTKDAVVIATVETIGSAGSIEEYAVKLFEQSGIGQKSKDNGLLIVVAKAERKVRIEVGYDLEEFITDGFAGDVIRRQFLPAFRENAYGAGLLAGTTVIINRIAEKRGVTLDDVPRAASNKDDGRGSRFGVLPFIFLIILLLVISRTRRHSRFGGPRFPWGGFGGPFGGFGGGFGGRGGFGGGGFGGGFGGGGGGFGGFGGGRSGGGGASGGW